MTQQLLGSTKKVDRLVIYPASLTADVSGVLPVANGGTGTGSYTDGQLNIGQTSGNTLAKHVLSGGATMDNGGVVTLATATTSTLGAVKVDGVTTVISSGVVSAVLPCRSGGVTANILSGGNPTNGISVLPTRVSDSTNAAIINTTVTFYCDPGGAWATGAGTSGTPKHKLDTGIVSGNHWYHLYAIHGSAVSDDFTFSLAAPPTGPALPSGYTLWAYMGSYYYTSGNFLGISQISNLFTLNPSRPDQAGYVVTSGNVNTMQLVSCTPSGISVMADLRIVFTSSAANPTFAYAWPMADGDSAAATNNVIGTCAVGTVPGGNQVQMLIDTNQNWKAVLSGSGTLTLYVTVIAYRNLLLNFSN